MNEKIGVLMLGIALLPLSSFCFIIGIKLICEGLK